MQKLLLFLAGAALALSAWAYMPNLKSTAAPSAAQALCWPGDSAKSCWQHLEHQSAARAQ